MITKEEIDDLRSRLALGKVPQASRKTVAQMVAIWDSRNELAEAARRAGKSHDPEVRVRLNKANRWVAEQAEALRQVDYKGIEPGYGAPVGAAGPIGAAEAWQAGAPLPTSGVKMLGRNQPFATGNTERAAAQLGVLAKALTGDVDEREIRTHFGDAGGVAFKDMLTTGGGGVLVPDSIAGFVIDKLRARSVVNALGARTVPMGPGSLRVPRVSADPTPAWLAEGATITEEDGNLDDVTLEAKRLTAIVKFSDELDEDSDPTLVGDVLANSLSRAFAVELDRAALVGSGSGAEPRGVTANAGILTTAPTVADWSVLTGLKAALEGANSLASGFVLSPATLNTIETKIAENGHYVEPPQSIADLPRLGTTSVNDTTVIGADWSQLMIGIRVRFELRRLVERYAEEGKVGLRARIRADVQLAHPESFAVATIA